MSLCMPIRKVEFQLGVTVNVISYFIFYHICTCCIILLTQYWDWSYFVGEPAEIHQCRLSGPPREQEQARPGGWDPGRLPRMYRVADGYVALIDTYVFFSLNIGV